MFDHWVLNIFLIAWDVFVILFSRNKKICNTLFKVEAKTNMIVKPFVFWQTGIT